MLLRVIRLLQYGSAVMAGAALVLVSSPSVNSVSTIALNNVLGCVLLVAGTICLIGAAMQRWIWEWVALFFVSGAIGVYTVAICAAAVGNNARLAGAGAILMLFFALAIRLVDLTVYWIKNVRTAKIKRNMEDDD
jgi:hypothetical protein